MTRGGQRSADPATVEVREGLQFDAERLAAYLAARLEGFSGPLAVRQFSGGQSNPTYLLTTPARRYVLRRKPPGELLESAHAVDREYRVITALAAQSAVPVPQSHLLCSDDAVIGTMFYVMEHVAGRIFWDPALPEVAREARRDLALAMCDALAALHRVDPQAAGLGDFGRASGYISRQVARWTGQYLGDVDAGRVASMDRLIEWLPLHYPGREPPAAVVHGDYRLDNLVFHPQQPRLLAILDWELSTLGDPCADFAYSLLPYRMPKSKFLPGLLGLDVEALGLPREQELVTRYAAATGVGGIDDLDFYMAFCLFRLAGILYGIRGRVARGTAVSARAREYAGYTETLADLAWRQAQAAS